MGTQGWLRLGPEPLHFFSFFLFCKRKGGHGHRGLHPSVPLPCPGTLTYLGHAQDHQELPENVDEVEEEINAVPGGGREGGMDAQGGPPCPLCHPPRVPSTHQM